MMNILQKLVSGIALLCLAACASEMTNKRAPTANIAVLMPLTGEYAQMGQRLASMVELGLEDSLEGKIKVMTYDAADDEKILASVQKLKAKNSKIILGPIFSASTSTVVSKVTPGVTVLTLSNNPALAGDCVYVFGHSPMKQTERIIDYMLNSGYKDFITLLPVSKYSREMANVMSSSLVSNGAKLEASEFYTEKEESIAAAVSNIAKIVENINESEAITTKPVIYISDESISVKKLFDALKRHNLDVSSVIIGDDKIDINYDSPISYLFTGSLSYDQKDLLTRLKEKLPGVNHLDYMDLMAYDLGKITAHTLGQGLTAEQFVLRLNTSGHLYIGASGQVKFTDHVAERKYDIIQRDGSGYSLLDAAR